MDKRRHPRESAAHPVKLTAAGGQRYEGTIRNFSAGGLLVELTDPPPVLPPALDVFVGHDMPIVGARVVRRMDDCVALAFDRVQLGLAAKLRPRTPDGHPAAPRDRVRTHDPELSRRLVEACEQFVVVRTDAFLEHAKDRLIDAADTAGSNVRQAQYFEAFTILRRRQSAIETGLGERIVQRGIALVPAREGPPVGDDAEDELALVDETEFDIWLIESDIASNAESTLHAELQALHMQLGSLLHESVDARTSPFGPRALATHCSDVLIALALDPLARKFALRSFGEVVLREAAPFYRALSEQLTEAGFTYQEPRRVRRPVNRESAPPNAPQPVEQTEPVAAQVAVDAPTEAGDAKEPPPTPARWTWAEPTRPAGALLDMQRLLRRPRRGVARQAPLAVEPDRDEPGLDPAMLQTLLEELQVRSQRSRNLSLEKRMRHALDELGAEQEHAPALSEAQGEALFLADELLTSMTSDLIATDQGKNWIRELEVPLLKLLLEDEDIVGERDHPVRRLLDRLGQAHWRADSDVARERMMVEEVDRVVNALVRGGRLTRERLEEAADTIDRLVRRARQRAESNTRRVLEACRGQERLRRARGEVDDWLASRFGDREVSEVLAELLDSGYKDLLAVEALRSDTGRGEDGTRETFAVVEQLDSRLAEDRPFDPAQDEQLLGLVRERLEMTGTDPTAQQDLIDRLRAHLTGEAPARARRLEFGIVPADAERPIEGDEPKRDPDTIDERLWLGQAKLLDVGDWMIFPDENGKGRPLKLAWINASRERYVFVDRDGHKALELNQTELASRIGAGEAALGVDGERSLTDRSWQAIVERLQQELAHHATHDGTSGLLNRREFERRVRLRISESKLARTTHGLVLIDLDQFRLINSSAGHDAGDQMLHETGATIQQLLAGQSAEVARTGSDEFAVLLPRAEKDAIALAAEQIRVAIKDFRLDWKGRHIGTTASLGWVLVDRDAEGFSALFNQLEIACRSARETGDSVRAFVGSDEKLARKDRALLRVRQLEEALLRGRLVLLAHRIHPLEAWHEEGAHYEVLARIRTADGEVISPQEFVTAAEAYGRVHLLDRAVLDNALEALANSPVGQDVECLAVNISGLTFGRAGFIEHVIAALERNDLEPHRLCLEITESAAMSDLARCADVVRELKALGCRFSLDDFGTGLSSFSYLKHLPVDYLKIDGSFVRNVHEDEDDRGLVRSMHEIAHLLGKRTIAEYVESPAIIDVLKGIGIDYGQGHALEKPRPLLDVLQLPGF